MDAGNPLSKNSIEFMTNPHFSSCGKMMDLFRPVLQITTITGSTAVCVSDGTLSISYKLSMKKKKKLQIGSIVRLDKFCISPQDFKICVTELTVVHKMYIQIGHPKPYAVTTTAPALQSTTAETLKSLLDHSGLIGSLKRPRSALNEGRDNSSKVLDLWRSYADKVLHSLIIYLRGYGLLQTEKVCKMTAISHTHEFIRKVVRTDDGRYVVKVLGDNIEKMKNLSGEKQTNCILILQNQLCDWANGADIKERLMNIHEEYFKFQSREDSKK